MHKVTLISGDGIGPEVINSAISIIEKLGVDISWDIQNDAQDIEKIVASIKENKVALKGPISTPIGIGFRSINVALRRELDAYANIRPVKSFKGLNTRYENIDLVIIRENLEDLYAGIEFKEGEKITQELIKSLGTPGVPSDSGISIKAISRSESRRIARFAFEYARKNKRKKITCVHKANIMKYTDGLFLEEAQKVAENYKDIEFNDSILDATAMKLVKSPEIYDMLLCPNLYGDVLSDLAAGLVGGLGLIASGNIGDQYALFEAVHGSAPSMTGKNVANPTAVILASCMMLKYISENETAEKIENAIQAVFLEGEALTKDLAQDGAASTQEFTKAILNKF